MKIPQISKFAPPLFRFFFGKMNQGDMGVSLNGGTPKSSIFIGISIINHPFWGFSPYVWKHPYGFLQQLWLFCMLIPVSFRVCDGRDPHKVEP